jgi:hypothetical protein
MDFWVGSQTAAYVDPAADYAAHLATIRDRLPPDLLATEQEVSLHDSRLRNLRLEIADGLLTLDLQSYSGEKLLGLVYEGVERFESLADPDIGLLGPAGYGDLGYSEVDILPNGAFEHRLLFSTGIELRVAFRGFKLLQAGSV